MRDKNILGKEQAFKVAIISDFNCQTFEDFVSALSEKMEHLSKVADHLTVYGHDAYNKWFRFHVKSFRYQPLNNTIILTIYYKWEQSSDKESNWHEEDLVIFSTTYAGYKRDADRIYRKNKPHDDAVDALSYTVVPERRNGKYLASRIEAAIRDKVRKEHDISVGLFKDTFSFEYMDSTFNGYVKSIDCVTEGDSLCIAPALRQIVLRDLVVSICDTKGDGTEIDIPIKWIAFWTNYFAVRRGGPNPDVITGVHISRDKGEWLNYRDRPNYDLEPPKTPVTFSAYPAFEQWKKKNPFAYEIIFTLISYYGKKHGRDAKSEMYFIKQNFRDRIIGNVIGTDGVGMHCPKVNHFKIKDIYIGSEYVRIELDDITYTDATGTTRKIDCTYTASVMKVEYRIVQEICSEVDTRKAMDRVLKNSFYGTQAISLFDGKAHIDTDDPCWDLINPDLLNKEKENKEMKNEHKIIINHNAVIAIDGKYKSVVKLREGEKWNTKLGVVMVVAKFTRRDLYKLLRTIKNPGNETIDRIADLIQMGSGNGGIRAFKWYQDAIKVKRPAAGKQVSIDITYEEA